MLLQGSTSSQLRKIFSVQKKKKTFHLENRHLTNPFIRDKVCLDTAYFTETEKLLLKVL